MNNAVVKETRRDTGGKSLLYLQAIEELKQHMVIISSTDLRTQNDEGEYYTPQVPVLNYVLQCFTEAVWCECSCTVSTGRYKE